MKRASYVSQRGISDHRTHNAVLLLYWPVYFIVFYMMEHICTGREYHLMHCSLDTVIPFNELFIIPYVSWYVLLAVVLAYTFIKEGDAFRSMMFFLMITFTVSLVINMIYPTYQDLRPDHFERDNVFTYMTGILYMIDTETNVCPSMHVTGAMAVAFTVRHCRRLKNSIWKILSVAAAVLISAATLFIKQHSVIDVASGFLLGFLAYPICYRRDR